MSKIIQSLLGEKKLQQLLQRNYRPEKDNNNFFANSDYLFFIFSNNKLKPLQKKSETIMRSLNLVNLESTRINEYGGHYQKDCSANI